MEIKRIGNQSSTKGPSDWFTGTVRIDPLFDRTDPARVSGGAVTFEPAARTAWHTHPLGQTLIVIAGCGRVQREGGPVEEIHPGDVVLIAPGEKHWHGAAPTTAMTHIAVQEKLNGKPVDWMEPVTDEQYGLTPGEPAVVVPIMLETLKELLTHQYEASLSTLHLCIARCPDELWNGPVANWKFCRAAFHTVFCSDMYLQPTEEMPALKSQPFHQQHKEIFGDYEEVADKVPVQLYEKTFVTSYLRNVRAKAQATIAGETAEILAGPSGFSWRKCSRAELHVYNIRHIQHHAAQFSLRLRLDVEIDIPWVSHAWKEG